MDRLKAIHDLQFQQDPPFHDDVRAITDVETYTVESDGYWNFRSRLQAFAPQAMKQTGPIRIFQQARTEGAVNLDRAPKDAVRKFGRHLQVVHDLALFSLDISSQRLDLARDDTLFSASPPSLRLCA